MKFIKLFALLIASMLVACGLTACGMPPMDMDLDGMGFTVKVKYECFEGSIDGKHTIDLRAKPGSLLLEPKGQTQLVEPQYKDHICAGWYTAYTEENGVKIFDDANKWNFETDRVEEGKNYTLYCRWERKATITVHYDNGQEDMIRNWTPGNHISLSGSYPTKDGYTFSGYFADEACTTLFDFNTPYPMDKRNVDIYCGWVLGEYVQIQSADDFMKIKNGLSKQYLLINDIELTQDVYMMANKRFTPFKGVIEGNGRTIKNVNIPSSVSTFAMFGYAKDATIQNINFQNFTVNSTGGGSTLNVATLVGEDLGGCKFHNITIDVTFKATNEFTDANIGGIVCKGYESAVTDCVVVINNQIVATNLVQNNFVAIQK